MSTSCKREKTLDMPAPSRPGFWGIELLQAGWYVETGKPGK